MKSDKYLLVFLFSVICLLNSVTPDISVNPVNSLLEIGKPAKLMCCSNKSHGKLEWKYHKGDIPITVCINEECHSSGYSIDNQTKGCFHLMISSTSLDVAGLYQCSEKGTTAVAGAYLIVYNFNCSSNFTSKDELVEGDIVEIQCKVEWRGKLPFRAQWMDKDGKQVNENIFSEEEKLYASPLPLGVVRPLLPSYTVVFSFLNEGITDENIDSDSPSVNWTSQSQLVMYPASNIKISCPIEDCQRTVGDFIECSAEGYPVPELHWVDWNEKNVSSTPVLKLDEPGTHKYTCIANNAIRGESKEDRNQVTVNTKEAFNCLSNEVFVGMIVGLVIIIVLVFKPQILQTAWSFLRKIRVVLRSKMHDNENEAGNISSNTVVQSESSMLQGDLAKALCIELRPGEKESENEDESSSKLLGSN